MKAVHWGNLFSLVLLVASFGMSLFCVDALRKLPTPVAVPPPPPPPAELAEVRDLKARLAQATASIDLLEREAVETRSLIATIITLGTDINELNLVDVALHHPDAGKQE